MSHYHPMSTSYERKDHLYNRAKSEGYRSRAAYKLKEINKKFHLLRGGHKVIDLGAWPGGWMQVARELVDEAGKVVGIDLEQIEEFRENNVLCITGDVREESNIRRSRDFAGGQFDVVLSDMSPKLSGIKEADRAAALGCAELCFWVAESVLKSGGSLVVKVFKSNEAEQFVRSIRPRFHKISREELDATRKTSNEFYVIATGFNRQESGSHGEE